MISLILGLGNIGKKYHHTRHNVGFDVIDHLIDLTHAAPQPRVKEFDWATFEAGERRIILAKPRTFMNLSGLAAARLLEESDLTPSQMMVVVDDFALPLGAVRIRGKGSAGGHNGLTSIIEEIGTQSFPRMRLGIGQIGRQTSSSAPNDGQAGRPAAQPDGHSREGGNPSDCHSREGGNPPPPKPVDNDGDIVDFVLSPFQTEERPAVESMIRHAADALLFAIAHRLDETMSKYNVNPALPENL